MKFGYQPQSRLLHSQSERQKDEVLLTVSWSSQRELTQQYYFMNSLLELLTECHLEPKQ